MKENGVDLSTQGYGWTTSIPFLSTSWGGFFDVLAAGMLGTFVELENRTKEDVAEQIWEEFEKRKLDAEKPKKKAKASKKKRKFTKSQKQFAAISEVAIEEPKIPEVAQPTEEPKKEEGVWNKVKNFYDQADQMAASQALLLNKALEEKGVVDKITDETGLNVIGKDAVDAKRKSQDESP